MPCPEGWYPAYRGRGRDPRGRGRGRGRGNTSTSSVYNYKNDEASSSKGRGYTSKKDPRNDPEYQEFLKKKGQNVVPEKTNEVLSSNQNEAEEEENILLYNESIHTEIIFLIDYKDLKWKNDPWFIMTRYLNSFSQYPGQCYKPRKYYENLLESTQTCFISHYADKKNQENYKFSKIIIKKIITVEEWGTSPYREKECFLGESPLKFNYWDYIQALSKVFYYENNEKKHSWFIKICSEAYEAPFPNWFVSWWTYFGPKTTSLPEIWKDYYLHWLDYSPTIKQMTKDGQTITETGPLHFFIEFSIPWIVRWIPKMGRTEQEIPCIRRHFYSKLWTKMFTIDPITEKSRCEDTENLVISTLEKYENLSKETIEDESFESLSRNLKMKQGILSMDEILKAHMAQMKKNLMKNFPDKFNKECKSLFWDKSDTEMGSNASITAGEAQDPYDFEEELMDVINETDKPNKGKASSTK